MPESGAPSHFHMLLHSAVQAGRGSVEPLPLGKDEVPRTVVVKRDHQEVAHQEEEKRLPLL
jgi:hypothetical protein